MSWFDMFTPPQELLHKSIDSAFDELAMKQAASTCRFYGRDAVIGSHCPHADEFKKQICNYCVVAKMCEVRVNGKR